MKRLKNLFAGLILLMALPIWRLLDWANVTVPFPLLVTLFQTIWVSLFIICPLSLMISKFTRWYILLSIIICAGLSYLTGPLSNQATIEPKLTHCGRLTYSGMLYPLSPILPQVHQDDLDIRNQMCWMTKLIKKVPSAIAPEDLADHLNGMKFRLMKPEIKYRASLPWITFLLGMYVNSSGIENGPLMIQNLGYWSNLYSYQISGREYAWYEWPHSVIVKFEYGLIENNWENIKIDF